MKRTERQHLKENELAHLAASAREAVASSGKQIMPIAIGLVVVVLAAFGYSAWRNSTQNRAGTLLAEAMAVQDARVGAPNAPGTPSSGPTFPTEREKTETMLAKFKAVADGFPGTEAGVFARYREAGAQMALGRAKEASAAYEQVIQSDGAGIYGQMAKLGLAAAQAQTGEFDKAIETFKDLSTRADGPLPVDGILLQLGRVYKDAGKPNDAQQTFNKLVQEFPESQFVADARRELEALKKS